MYLAQTVLRSVPLSGPDDNPLNPLKTWQL
jgi:hypothetical protein